VDFCPDRRAVSSRTSNRSSCRRPPLECGIIGEKLPGVESVSYGPTITGAHSPDERVLATTVPPFWEATLRLLGALADRPA
jgi:di/tripeptidase